MHPIFGLLGAVAWSVGGAHATPQTLSGLISIPLDYTYYITPNFTGNASEGFISISTNNASLAGLLREAQNSTFISYDEEFSQMLGPKPEAVLIQERSDDFAFEVRVYGIIHTEL